MPRHHTQPVSYLQQKAELSQFDDSAIRERRYQERAAFERAAAMAEAAREAGSIAGPVALGAAPGNDNVIYDPTHHAADYAGFVSRDVLERAHFDAVPEAVARSEEGGIVPAPHASTFDRVAGRGDKRHFEDDVRFQSREATGEAPLLADPTFYVTGGQDDRYLSTTMAANARIPTSKDAFVHLPNKGKRQVTPAYEVSLQEITNRRQEAAANQRVGLGGRSIAGQGGGPYSGARSGAYGAEDAHVGAKSTQLVGYRATAFKNGTPSMLASIGASVARNLDIERSSNIRRETIEDVRSRSKSTAILDSVPGTLPGYTGTRLR